VSQAQTRRVALNSRDTPTHRVRPHDALRHGTARRALPKRQCLAPDVRKHAGVCVPTAVTSLGGPQKGLATELPLSIQRLVVTCPREVVREVAAITTSSLSGHTFSEISLSASGIYGLTQTGDIHARVYMRSQLRATNTHE